ncbi:hypothetical protein BIW11_06826 [Tropilaelaps mercedesae]|uniref:CSD domain-containing protein n=1 Tax=Tropilaelaps mercedesae TaxID=418985 RepID=A0A1V9XWC3_9ACAR|nr:hypothetical protein BIW11_06826 [Tropilaelaps mercedesae]
MSEKEHGGGDALVSCSSKDQTEDLLEESSPKVVPEGQLDGHVDLSSEERQIKLATEARRAELIAEKLRGKVRWYNSRLCYGFIERDDTGHELFVHRNSIVMAPEELIFLKAQTPVLFDLWTLPDGRLEAQNVRAANGKPISLRDGKLLPRAACPHDDLHNSFRSQQPFGAYGGGCSGVPQYCLCCSRPLDYIRLRPEPAHFMDTRAGDILDGWEPRSELSFAHDSYGPHHRHH